MFLFPPLLFISEYMIPFDVLSFHCWLCHWYKALSQYLKSRTCNELKWVFEICWLDFYFMSLKLCLFVFSDSVSTVKSRWSAMSSRSTRTTSERFMENLPSRIEVYRPTTAGRTCKGPRIIRSQARRFIIIITCSYRTIIVLWLWSCRVIPDFYELQVFLLCKAEFRAWFLIMYIFRRPSGLVWLWAVRKWSKYTALWIFRHFVRLPSHFAERRRGNGQPIAEGGASRREIQSRRAGSESAQWVFFSLSSAWSLAGRENFWNSELCVV